MIKIACSLMILSLLLLIGCKANTVYIPIENTKTEYIDRLQRDSTYLKDSIRVYAKGDTVYQDRYQYLFRDRLKYDSIYVCDTIRVPYPVLEVKEVNRLRNWQILLMCLGGVLIGIAGIWIIWKIKR